LSQPQLAQLLKPFGVKPKGIRIGAGTPRGYRLADLSDAFSRYLPTETQHPQQESDLNEFELLGEVQRPAGVAGSG